MSQFGMYFDLGVAHILDIEGLDHILFIIALCAVYQISEWKNVIILVTAFTIGHSVTLILSTLNYFTVSSDYIEFLIPITIILTAISNILKKPKVRLKTSFFQANYLYALFFGLIHGLAFSNDLRSLLGKEASIINQLLAFNLGIEVGQIVVVVVFLITSALVIGIGNVAKRDWNLVISSAVMGVAIVLAIEAKFW
ncbi:MAG: HupE/UreJ family protein [Cyclobacteriaceae bacterium]|nr:HupE/UreJ family protein [Cyclobacteriaceae bacterium]MCH8516406.1 HupE/UreJ family protein [Cyclobacteriaceae bacterium]